MMRANKLALVLVDGSMAIEGNGRTQGTLVKMDVIVAGTNPVATDIIASSLMGFPPAELPTFAWVHKPGLGPTALEDLEVRGEKLDTVRRPFVKPQIPARNSIRDLWGAKEI